MAKAKKRNRASTKIRTASKVPVPTPANDVEGKLKPTPEREMHNDFRNTGSTARTAAKVIPPIETLYNAGKLSERQFKGLARYADVAHAANRSHIKSNIDFSVYGSGDGLPHFGVRMNIELGYLNRALGSLVDIAEAVCVREISVSQWAMEQGGSVMRERAGVGRAFIRWFEPRRKQHECAMLEIKMAGERLAAAIAA